MKTIEAVDSLVRGKIGELGFILDEVEFVKEHGGWVLTLYIDSDERPVTLEDCELVSRAIDPILDEKDPIEQSYFLSVSSIGIDRPLKKSRDFERNINNKITVKLYVPINKKKEYVGTLVEFDDDSITIAAEPKGEKMRIIKKDAALIRPFLDFSGIKE